MQSDRWLHDGIRAGIVEPKQIDPNLSVLLAQIRHASVALFGKPVEMLFSVTPLSDVMQAFRHVLGIWQKPGDLEGNERNIIFTLAYIWYSIVMGNIITKDEAASWLISQLPDEYADTLQAARAEYLGLTKKNWATSMSSVERLVSYTKKQITDRLE